MHNSSFNNNHIDSVKTYINAETQKEIILSDNKNKSGIYKWVNTITGEFYIGSAINLYKRLLQYYQNSYITHPSRGNSIICFSLVKYGYSNFNLEILEYCNKDKLIEREQYYLDTLNPSYNILKYAYSSLGYNHTLEVIKKISETRKGKYTQETNSFFGKNHTNEVKELMKQVAYTRDKSPNAKAVILKDLNNNIIKEFKSMLDLSIYLKADRANLAKHRNSGKPFRELYYIVLKEK